MDYITDTSSSGIEARDTFAHKHATRVYHSANTGAVVCLRDTGNDQAPIAQSNVVVKRSRLTIGLCNDWGVF
jgi:hypothetical protein